MFTHRRFSIKKVVRILSPCLLLLTASIASYAAAAVQPQEVVVKVQAHGWRSRNYGTAWCLNAECDVLVTNHHVARIVGPHPMVSGVKVADTLSATGENDEGAQVLATVIGPLKLAWLRDIALMTTQEPLARKGIRAVPFYPGQLQPDQNVIAFGFPGGKLESVRGKFLEEQGGGLLLFEMERDTSHGFSGGLILDEQGRAVGLLFGSAEDRPRFVYAVPVWSLADFVKKARPQLHAKLFSGELYRPEAQDRGAEAAVDVSTMEFPASPQDGYSPATALPESYLRPDEAPDSAPIARNNASPAVLELRRSAQEMSLQMNNFIARQTLLLSHGHAWQHELQIIDGQQHFRPVNGGKDSLELPLHEVGPVPGDEWAELVRRIGFDSSLAIEFQRDTTVDNHAVKVFRYAARPEDEVCALRIARPFHKTWKGSLACSGLIWTDEQSRILRVTQNLTPPPDTGLAGHSIVVLYGWWDKRLVPAQMYLRSRTTDGKTFATRAKFDNYRVFAATTKITYRQQPVLQGRLRGE